MKIQDSRTSRSHDSRMTEKAFRTHRPCPIGTSRPLYVVPVVVQYLGPTVSTTMQRIPVVCVLTEDSLLVEVRSLPAARFLHNALFTL
jgi:hypothetical protein